jgi:hypothetical protein
MSPIEKSNVLILGPIGTGKTWSLRTIPEMGRELFVISLEPGIEKTLGDIPCEAGCHYHYIPFAVTDWGTIEKSLAFLNTMTMEQIVKMTSPDRAHYRQLLEVITTAANFKCDRCKQEFGPVDYLKPEQVVAMDGLTGLTRMASQFVTGSKVMKSQPEIWAIQDAIRNIIYKFTGDCLCSFVLTSHIERETNKVTGLSHLTVSTIGVALAPDIPKPFDEVILTRRTQDKKFYWSTSTEGVDLKARKLPFSDTIPPDFAQIL